MPGLSAARRGATVVDMIVALALAAVIAAGAATALAGTERYVRVARAGSDSRRTLREAEAVLSSDLRAAPADSLRVRGDTAVDFLGLVGVSVVCASSGPVVVLPPDTAARGLPFTSWRAAPDAGDLLAVFDTAGGGAWHVATVDSAVTRSDGAGCTPSTGLLSSADSAARRPVTRLRLATTPASAIPVGAPARVLRGGRYALTHSGDGSWTLSYRRCAGAPCGAAQPVVGPLAAPADSGLRFTSIAAEFRVETLLRTPPGEPGAQPQSALLRITVRNRATGDP